MAKKNKGRPVSRVVLFINPLQLGMTADEVGANMEITMKNEMGNHKDDKVSYAVQFQIDTGFMAFAFRTNGRERKPMWMSRPMFSSSNEHGDHILMVMTDLTADSPIAEGGQWEDIQWDKLRVVPWGVLQKSVFEVITQVYRLVIGFNNSLALEFADENHLGLMISIDGDRRWIPPIIRNNTQKAMRP